MPHHRHHGLGLMPWGASWWSPGRMMRLMDEMMRQGQVETAEAQVWVPNAEMHQTDTELLINVELPGVKKEDLEVQVTGDMVSIKGQKKAPEGACPEGNVCCTELCYGPFERTITWPVEVKPEEAKSKLEEGVLQIRVPLSERARMRAPKRIEIQ